MLSLEINCHDKSFLVPVEYKGVVTKLPKRCHEVAIEVMRVQQLNNLLQAVPNIKPSYLFQASNDIFSK